MSLVWSFFSNYTTIKKKKNSLLIGKRLRTEDAVVLEGVAHAIHDSLLAILCRVELHLCLHVLCGHRNAYFNSATLHDFQVIEPNLAGNPWGYE